MYTEELLEKDPFLVEEEKEALFMRAMKEALLHHDKHCEEFHTFLESQGKGIDTINKVEDIPFLPVTIFKELELRSVEEKEIKKRAYSSATSSGKPSVIVLDQRTMKRQQKALTRIMQDRLGKEKKAFLVFDEEATLHANKGQVHSRTTAIRGMIPFAKSFDFLLDKELHVHEQKWKEAIGKEHVCFFGFTWLLYQALEKAKEKVERLPKKEDAYVLHIGGWKKLKDLDIKKEEFNERIERWLRIPQENIIDFYGMTEQLGTVYPDCPAGNKHVSTYAEVLIRDVNTLAVCEQGKPGFIQLISPLPHSYPGISLLTDDLGTIYGVDTCPCGKKGKFFRFEKRAEKAEMKGCGDTIEQ